MHTSTLIRLEAGLVGNAAYQALKKEFEADLEGLDSLEARIPDWKRKLSIKLDRWAITAQAQKQIKESNPQSRKD